MNGAVITPFWTRVSYTNLFSWHHFFKQLPLLNHRNDRIKKTNITFLYCWYKKQLLYTQFEDAYMHPRSQGGLCTQLMIIMQFGIIGDGINTMLCIRFHSFFFFLCTSYFHFVILRIFSLYYAESLNLGYKKIFKFSNFIIMWPTLKLESFLRPTWYISIYKLLYNLSYIKDKLSYKWNHIYKNSNMYS